MNEKTEKTKVLRYIVLTIFIITAGYFIIFYARKLFEKSKITYSVSKKDCQTFEKELTTLLNNSRLCNKDRDCVLLNEIPLGCPFGCYRYINKKHDKTKILNLIREYQQTCDPECLIQLECMSPPKDTEIFCIDNECTQTK